MDEPDIPIFKKTYDLFKTFHALRNTVPKADRHTLWQRIEETTLCIIEQLLLAGQRGREGKQMPLEQASVQINLLRVLVRLTKDTKVIDLKNYAQIQQDIDEIGRMLGGWIKSVKPATPPPRGIFKKMKERRGKCRADAREMFGLRLSSQLLSTLRPSELRFSSAWYPSDV